MMATKISLCLSIIFVAVYLLHTTESRCVDVPVEYCRRLGFTGTYFPNHFYHRTISEAEAAFNQFIAADGECSDNFGKFVCAAYFPGCTLANNLRVDIRFNPCRKLCNSAFKPCKLSFKRLGIKWPPELRCGTFPTKECTSVMDELVPLIPMPPTPTPTVTSCEPISYVECQNLEYDKTTMPNRFGQTTQETAGIEVDNFKPLIAVKCSEALQTFVCASFFPPCSDNIAETPCRSLCEAAKDGCVRIMRSFGYEWPEHLRCSNLPNDTCFDGGFSSTNDSTAVQPSSTPVESQCEPLTIPLCQDLGYSSTKMPNMLGQSFQQDAQMTLQTFTPLLQTQCSPALKPFLCAAYAPSCSASTSHMPCRSLCEAAKDGCLPTLETLGYGWPEPLNCSSLSNENCYDAGFSSETQIPDGSCEDIILPMCLNMSYNQTRLPNVLGHTSQLDALTAIIDNAILVGCSPTMIPFLCSVYTPMCRADGSAKPCRNLCQQTMYECQQFLTVLNLKWPEELECSQFTDDDPSCVTDSNTASTMPTQVESQCEPLTIPLCQYLGYTSTMIPNMLGQSLQQDAQMTLQTFTPLLQTQCSPALKPFLCAAYAPKCSASTSQMPCRSLCKAAKEGCLPTMEAFGYGWPEPLNCSSLSNENCYDAGFSSEAQIPDSSCEDIILPMCLNMSYSQTHLPNVLGHTSQYEALSAIIDNAILAGCSPTMIPFLCSVYTPMCTADGSAKPCRNLCQQTMYECQQFLTALNLKWPEELECSHFTDDDPSCVTDSNTASTMPTQVESQCEPLTIPLCKALNYTSTMMPNMLGHSNQNDAMIEVHQFYPLIKIQCSPALQPLLCAIYAPNCSAESTQQIPCRSLCEMVRDGCASVLDTFGFGWPEHLNCSYFPNENCYDAGFSSEVQNPDGSCEDIILPMCLDMSYSQTRLPNVMGHTSQYDALSAIIDNAILAGCSPTMIPFLCSVYTPMCRADGSAKPCRNLCQQTMYECQQFLTALNLKWPEELECSHFTDDDPSCVTDSNTASTMPTQVESQCEPLTIPLCKALNYTSTMMPNMLGHSNQNDAMIEVHQFYPLIKIQCSPALQPLLCAIYAPNCSAESTQQIPCRSLCEMVRDGCASVMDTFGFGWPEHLNCSSFPNGNCYDAGFSSEVQNPDGSCEDIILPMCLNMSYSQTRLPNVLGHTSQYDALSAIIDNAILAGCSPTMIPFLCSVYTPMCTADGSAKPCRSLCQQTMYECQQFLTAVNLKWPEELECSQFTDDDPSCNVDDIDSEKDTSIPRCEPLRNPQCEGLSYDTTQIPNLLGDVDQDNSELIMTVFAPIIATGCSPDLKNFVCAVVSPPCSSGVQVPPCRSLCETVERECGSIFSTGADGPPAFQCFLLPNQNCYDGKTTIGISPTVSSDEDTMYTDEIATDGHAVDVGVVYGSNCVEIKSRRYDVTDLGLSEYFRGWVDVQGQGAANDYCRVVRRENGNLDLTCALAGTSGMSEFNYNMTSLDEEKFVPGRYGEWYVRDENGDGRDDYCRCVYRDLDLYVSCIPAMTEGFVGNEEFRVEAKGCGVEQFNPFIGPRP